MELSDAFKARRSYRLYEKTPVPREVVADLIRATQNAPVSCNLQLTQFVAVDDPALLEDLRKRVSYKFAYAPVCIVVTYDPRFTVEHSSAVMTAGMAVDHLALLAAEKGLATLPMAGFAKDEIIKEKLGIPAHLDLLLLVAVGYPKGARPRPVPKLPLERIMSWNRYELASLNGSPRLVDHTVESIAEYRSRIAPVYLERFRLHTYDDSFYRKALEAFLDAFPKGVGRVLDLVSYDGLFAKLLIESGTKAEVTVTDYDPYVRDFLSERLGVRSAPITLANEVRSDETYDVATLVFKAHVTAELPKLLASAAERLAPGGALFVAVIEESRWRRFAKFLRRLKRTLSGKFENIYEGNPFYRVGAFTDAPRIEDAAKTARVAYLSASRTPLAPGVRLATYHLRKS